MCHLFLQGTILQKAPKFHLSFIMYLLPVWIKIKLSCEFSLQTPNFMKIMLSRSGKEICDQKDRQHDFYIMHSFKVLYFVIRAYAEHTYLLQQVLNLP